MAKVQTNPNNFKPFSQLSASQPHKVSHAFFCKKKNKTVYNEASTEMQYNIEHGNSYQH